LKRKECTLFRALNIVQKTPRGVMVDKDGELAGNVLPPIESLEATNDNALPLMASPADRSVAMGVAPTTVAP
jgi:hypothetical protein